MQFIADKLFNLKLIPTRDLEEIADSIVCDKKNKACSYNECDTCKLNAYQFSGRPENVDVAYEQWVTKKIEHGTGDAKGTSMIVTKETVIVSQIELTDIFQTMIDKFKRHLFNIRLQCSRYRDIRTNLTDSDCLIHIDWSENYNCKFANEIQAVHFGGSHQQASLQTGILYTTCGVVPFCTISACRQHGPAAIWAHLDPIFDLIKFRFPRITNVNFFTDGPATQYKQKNNFLLSTEVFAKGFRSATWNYFEASHGKGAPDGIGGSIKRTADRLVNLGTDIPDAHSLYRELMQTQSGIELFLVEETVINKKAEELSSFDVATIKGTMRFHQVITLAPSKILCRDISCFCSYDGHNIDCTMLWTDRIFFESFIFWFKCRKH